MAATILWPATGSVSSDMKKRGFLLFKWEDLFKHWDVVDRDSPVARYRFSFRETLAMIIAAFSIVLPWVLAILGSLTLVLFLIYKFYLRQ
jgi:hypothetical protein